MKYIVTLNNKKYEIEVTEEDAAVLSVNDSVPSVCESKPDTVNLSETSSSMYSGDGEKITSPMPGTVLSVSVSDGQQVKAGDVILVLEAMKMENDIVAPHDGIIRKILVTKGSTVDTDQTLAIM